MLSFTHYKGGLFCLSNSLGYKSGWYDGDLHRPYTHKISETADQVPASIDRNYLQCARFYIPQLYIVFELNFIRGAGEMKWCYIVGKAAG